MRLPVIPVKSLDAWLAVDRETVHVLKFTTDLGFNVPESRRDFVGYW
jgi:hypothetical protein